MKKNEICGILKRSLLSLVVLLGIFGILILLLRAFGIDGIAREDIQAFVSRFGVLGPLVFTLISFLQVTFIPIPSTVTVLAGSYLFGALPSFFYSYLGIILGSLFAFFLGKRLGRPFAVWVAGSEDRLDGWIAKLRGREHALAWIVFFCPFLPDDTICAVVGLFKISYTEFLAMQLVTRATTIGATLLFMSGEIIPFEGGWLVLLAVVAVLFVLLSVFSLIYYERLADLFNRMFQRTKK